MSDGEPSVSNRFWNPFRLERRALVLYHLLVLCLAVLSLDRVAAWQFLPADDSREIVLISSRSCPHSRAVRARLEDAGIPFREVEARDDPLRSALASWAFQSLSVPIVVVGPEVVYGNRRDKIDAALSELGYEVEGSSPPSS